MKKFILSIIFIAIFLFFFTPGSNAQDFKGCWDKKTDQISICNQADTECISKCTSENFNSCQSGCSKTLDACYKQTRVDYDVCINRGKQTSVNSEGNELSQEKKVLTCDEVWKIVGTQDCPDWAINNDLGGVWCNITSLERAPWTVGLAPKYTFAPGTSCGEASQPSGQKEKKSLQAAPNQEENPVVDSIIELVKESEIIDCKTVPVKGCLRFGIPSGVEGVEWFNPVTGKDLEETLNWQPIITKEAEQAAWQFKPEYILPDKENITVTAGQGQLKNPNINQVFIMVKSLSDQPLFVTFLDSKVESTLDAVQLRYTWVDDSGSIINLSKESEIQFVKPVQDEKTQEIKRMIKLNKGELEVKVKNTNSKNKFGVQGDFFDLFVVGTHFWVKHDDKRQVEVIGVYEGEVEVKTKDGKTATITPNGNKPGVVVIVQKLSVVKLAVTGLVVVVIGGGILFLKRKFAAIGFNKKKK